MDDGNDEHTESLANRYIEAYKDKINLYKEQDELLGRLEVLEKQETIFKDIISRCYGKGMEADETKHQYPIILGSSHTRMSVTNLGVLATSNEERFHTQTAIYPIGYTMRRKHLMHKSYKKKTKNKIIYTCTIDRESVFKIKADDGCKWEGDTCWERFTENFDGKTKFKDIEDFFGFTNATLQQLIEGLGDINRFTKYVPVEERRGALKDA